MFIFAHSFIPKMYLSNVENIRSGHQHSFLLYFLGTQETVLLTILPLVKLSTNSGQWIVNGGDLNHFLPEAVKYPCMKIQPLLFLQQWPGSLVLWWSIKMEAPWISKPLIRRQLPWKKVNRSIKDLLWVRNKLLIY